MKQKSFDTLIETSPAETRIARLDQDGALWSLDIERGTRANLVGGLYWGRIKKIDKKLNAAFLDIGLEADVMMNRAKDYTEGQSLLVQISRDARDGKGILVTSKPTLMGRYLSWVPGRAGVNYANAIGKGKARSQLQDALQDVIPDDQGVTVRLPALAVKVSTIRKEWEALQSQLTEIEALTKTAKTPGLLQAAPSLPELIARDCEPEGRIAVDDRRVFYMLEKLFQSRMPDLKAGLVFHSDDEPLFEAAPVEEQLEEALSRVIEIPGGGTLVFDQTEAMMVVDVNMATGETGAANDDAIYRTNKRAIECLARQISLRNLSGLIVVDLLKLKNKGRLRQLTDLARALMKQDERATDVLGITAAGLLEITRQRGGNDLQSLMTVQFDAMTTVHPQAQACAILRAASRLKGGGRPMAYGTPNVIEALRNDFPEAMVEIKERLGRDLMLRIGTDTNPPQVEMGR